MYSADYKQNIKRAKNGKGSFKQKGDEDSEKICKYLYEYISERRT